MVTRRTVAKGALVLPLFYLESRRALATGSRHDGSLAYDDDCGVASGCPTPASVVIWTRVPARARIGVGPLDTLPVHYEVASAAGFEAKDIIAQGVLTTDASRDFTVKTLVGGLTAFNTYYYRFRTDTGYDSAVGRTKTAPAPGANPPRLRIGAATCQKFSDGYYAAYTAMCKEDFDFCVHLGDHIYENEQGRGGSGDPLGREAKSLDDYRSKYRYYLSDPVYREARRLFCWVDLWDDHEVMNDQSSADRLNDPARFTAGYQAYLEYMPIAQELIVTPGSPPEIELYRSYPLGDLLELIVTDQRQYRSPNACSSKFFTHGCDAMYDTRQTMLGVAQKAWLKEALGASRCTWKLVLNEVMMAPLRVHFLEAVAAGGTANAERVAKLILGERAQANGDRFLNLDQWDGYPAERAELLGFIAERGIANVVLLTGDIHAAADAYLYPDMDTTSGKATALEIVTTSVTSTTLGERVGGILGGAAQRIIDRSNPHIAWSDIHSHGYTTLDVTAEGMEVRHVVVATTAPDAPASVGRTTKIPVGIPEFRN